MIIPGTDVVAVAPLGHNEAMQLQRVELARTVELLTDLDDADWATATPDCPGWDVRRMYLHVLGACEGAAPGELLRQMTAALKRRRRAGGPLEASLSAVQIEAREDLGSAGLVDRLAAVAPQTIRHRERLPAMLRSGVRMKVDGPVVERWRLGYLVDTIYLRDLWMHRIDACRATGRTPMLTPDHDGRIVADVVAEWARRHGRPFTLDLGGAAGGQYRHGDGGEHLSLDAVEFCRTLAGRTPASGLLATVVPF